MDPITQITDEITRRLFVELEASGRHVHVTKEQAEALFGHRLTPKRPRPSRGSTWQTSGSPWKDPKGNSGRWRCLGRSGRRPRWRCP